MSQEDPLTPTPPPGQDQLPCDDGEPMETALHRFQMNLLIDSLTEAWSDRSDVFIGGNMFVYFSELQVKSNDFRGPDVFVALDVEQKRRKSWVAWEEGGRLPDVVIELTSDSTRRVDHVDKKRIYARVWRLPAYFIFDPETAELEGFALDSTGRDYAPITPDEAGDLEVAPLGLKLGVRPGKIFHWEGDFLRWIDARGEPLLHPKELADRAQAQANEAEARAGDAEARARNAEARAGDAQERLRQAEAEAERLRLELERLRSRK